MLWLQDSVIGTVAWDAPVRPTGSGVSAATVTVELLNAAGSAAIAAGTTASPGLNAVNTTLSSGCGNRAETVEVTSATGITPGYTYLLSASATGPSERVVCESLSGTTVRLKYATTRAYPNGALFQSTRISHEIAAATLTPAGDNWRLRITYDLAGVNQPPKEVLFGVSKHYPYNPLSTATLFAAYPLTQDLVPASLDFDDLFSRAFDEVCTRLSQTGVQAADYIGTERLERPCVEMAYYLCAQMFGQGFEAERHRSRTRLDQLMQQFAASTPVDENRDDKLSKHEQSGHTSMRIVRTR